MANPLRAAIREGERVDRALSVLFGRYLGSTVHPRGRVLSAYRQARRAIAQAYKLPGAMRVAALLDALRELELTLADIGRGAMAEAVRLGIESAESQIAAYAAAGVAVDAVREHAVLDALTAGWAASVSPQLETARAMVAAGAEKEMLLGGGGRLGVVQAAPTVRDASRWLALAASQAFRAWSVGLEPRGELLDWQRLAVAAVDGRTTDCCLRVNGQVVNGVDAPFILTGEPRFADKLVDPPFHWNCRTSVVLYMEEFDNGATGFLREQSQAELARRRELDEQIRDIKVELAKIDQPPTVRRYKDDTKQARALKRKLRQLRRERDKGSANIPFRGP